MSELPEITQPIPDGQHINHFSYDAETKTTAIDCDIDGKGNIPGWDIELSGFMVDENTITRVWHRIRRHYLQPEVDAAGLFYFADPKHEIPIRMTLLPNSSLVDKGEEEAYNHKLADVLRSKALPCFVKILSEATTYYSKGMPLTETLASTIFPEDLVEALAAKNAKLAEKEHTERCRKVRKAAKAHYKAAARKARQAKDCAERTKASAESAAAAVAAASETERTELQRLADAEQALAVAAEATAQAVQRQAWDAKRFLARTKTSLHKLNSHTGVADEGLSSPIPIDFSHVPNISTAELETQALEAELDRLTSTLTPIAQS